MWSQMLAPSRANAVWLINQACEPQLYSMALSAGTGAVPVYMPAGGISGSPYSTLFGKPVIPVEQASALGDVGDIMLADMSKYLIAEKAGIQMASSMHVKFIYDEMAFRVTYRVDGQPIMNKAITPFKGANDLSCFVALAAR
jgi:HK97 family phage major capsid protein